MAIQFQNNYQLLELDTRADWDTANKNYRRLVHKWHPDRFVDRPRERVHAQQQFIELTKAFNNLRAFYRENNRLPLESIKRTSTNTPKPASPESVISASDVELHSGFLNKRKPSLKSGRSSKLKPFLWAIPVGATLLAGMASFVVIDRNAKLKTIEEAQEVLRNAEPSPYKRDTAKIAQSQRRSTLLDQSSGSNGNMGNKLSKDMFR